MKSASGEKRDLVTGMKGWYHLGSLSLTREKVVKSIHPYIDSLLGWS